MQVRQGSKRSIRVVLIVDVNNINQGTATKPSFRQKMDTQLRLIGHRERDQFHLSNNPSKDKATGVFTLAALTGVLAILIPFLVYDFILPSMEH